MGRMMEGKTVPILIVLVAILAFWYAAAIWMNAPWQQTLNARANLVDGNTSQRAASAARPWLGTGAGLQVNDGDARIFRVQPETPNRGQLLQPAVHGGLQYSAAAPVYDARFAGAGEQCVVQKGVERLEGLGRSHAVQVDGRTEGRTGIRGMTAVRSAP